MRKNCGDGKCIQNNPFRLGRLVPFLRLGESIAPSPLVRREIVMKTFSLRSVFCGSVICECVIAAGLVGCSNAPKQPDVSDNVRRALDQGGFKDVSESQDRDRGVITLKGHVPTDSDKAQAESFAKSAAGGQVVANEIQVLPPGSESDAKKVDSDVDKGIANNLDAALIQQKAKDDVKYDVKNSVVTLTGSVNSVAKRSQVEHIAAGIPNVRQVVNELEIRNPKATSN